MRVVISGATGLVGKALTQSLKSDGHTVAKFARPGEHDEILAEDRSVASGRPMAAIEAGKGRAPEPFMLARKSAGKAKADAVWHSNRADAGDPPGRREPEIAAPRSEERRVGKECW